MTPKEQLGILEILDNLNAIVEAQSLEEIEVTENYQFIPHKEEEETRELYWMKAGPNDLTLLAVKENFRAALKYLHHFYQKVKSDEERARILDGINAIMVLVGEATSKLERFDSLFKEKIPKLSEYKDLKNFYKRVTVRSKEPIEEEGLEEDLLTEERIEEVEGVHLLNDLEAIKRDRIYELFYLKNEASLDFFTEALSRNIKVACDFGEFAKEYTGEDPLVQIKNWEDKGLQLMAKNMLAQVKNELENYYKEASRFREVEEVALFQRAVFALMLAANPRNLIRQFSSKGCYQYFSDFLLFMRELLVHREFTRYLLYRSPSAPPIFSSLSKVVSSLIFLLYTTGPDRKEIGQVISELSEKKLTKEERLSSFLGESYALLKKMLEKHPSGPLFKALDLIREETKPSFDPLMLGNLPEKLGTFYLEEKERELLRIPAPIIQERIDKAVVSDEFRSFLFKCSEKGLKLLYVDFQDRTSWHEHGRVKAIESLSHEAQYSGCFSYVNLAKDTDFYNQLGLYRDLSESSEFIRVLYLQLSDESTGYHFSTALKKALFPDFMEKIVGKIWEEFFDKKEQLSLHERLDFIELSYHFITLKIIEIEKPDFITLTSKDGLDIGSTSAVEFLSLIKMGSKEKFKSGDFEDLRTILFAPTLLQRERVIHSERFQRLIEMIQLLENSPGFLRAFSSLFDKKTLELKLISLLPHAKE